MIQQWLLPKPFILSDLYISEYFERGDIFGGGETFLRQEEFFCTQGDIFEVV